LTVTATRFVTVNGRRVIHRDWYEGTVPDGAQIDTTAYVGSSQSFVRYRSELPVGAQIGYGASLCDATSLDIGPHGLVRLGEYALVTAARIICDAEVDIGDYALVSWDVILMDSYRVPLDPIERRRVACGERIADAKAARPIRLGRNSWVGFGACVLPGVTIGDGSIVAARSVVAADVPPYVVVAGNPARIVRRLVRDEIERS
jgi:acetyltransferase-like isoleucine patch superfamily enzyme